MNLWFSFIWWSLETKTRTSRLSRKNIELVVKNPPSTAPPWAAALRHSGAARNTRRGGPLRRSRNDPGEIQRPTSEKVGNKSIEQKANIWIIQPLQFLAIFVCYWWTWHFNAHGSWTSVINPEMDTYGRGSWSKQLLKGNREKTYHSPKPCQLSSNMSIFLRIPHPENWDSQDFGFG